MYVMEGVGKRIDVLVSAPDQLVAAHTSIQRRHVGPTGRSYLSALQSLLNVLYHTQGILNDDSDTRSPRLTGLLIICM